MIMEVSIGEANFISGNLTGCSSLSEPKISVEDATGIVWKSHTKSIGKVEIISVLHDGHSYIVQLQNEANCENGIDYASDQSGEIVKGETTIC